MYAALFSQFGTMNSKNLDEYSMLFPDKSEDYLKLMTLIDKIWLIDSGIVVFCYPLFEKNFNNMVFLACFKNIIWEIKNLLSELAIFSSIK